MKVVHSHHVSDSTFVVIQHTHLFQVNTVLVQDGKVKRANGLHLVAGAMTPLDEQAKKLALAEHVKWLHVEIEKAERYRELQVSPAEDCDRRIRAVRALIVKVAKHA
jgi:hypothetical protein